MKKKPTKPTKPQNHHPFLPVFCILDAPKVWEYIVISDMIASFFSLNHRKIYFAVYKKRSRTCCVTHLFSFIGTWAKMCFFSNLGSGRQNLLWCTCWLLKLTSLIFLMHICLPPKLFLDKIWMLVLACKPKWSPLHFRIARVSGNSLCRPFCLPSCC